VLRRALHPAARQILAARQTPDALPPERTPDVPAHLQAHLAHPEMYGSGASDGEHQARRAASDGSPEHPEPEDVAAQK